MNPSEQEPLDPPTEDSLTRRTFIAAGFSLVGAGYASAICYPVYHYLAHPVLRAAEATAVTEVSLPGAAKLQEGSALMFKFGTKPSMLIHHEDGSWVAMSAVCTHLGCTVKFEPEQKRIFCACHGGTYDPHTGLPIAGPPPKGLTPYQVLVNGENITVSKS